MLDPCCALTVCLPAFPAVQKLRRELDPAYGRWPVHFNVDCFPFHPSSMADELAPRIQAAVADVPAFAVRLAAVQCFGGRKGTMYAAVECADGGAARLHAALMAAFPDLDTGRPFQPHVTLGRFDDPAELHSATAAVAGAWTPIVCEVACVTLLARSRDGAFVATHEFPLGGPRDAWRRVNVPYVADAADAADGAVVAPSAAGFPLGKHWVCTLRTGGRALAKKRMMSVLIVDNSSSMGPLSQAAITTIGRGMFQFGDGATMVPGAVVVFSALAQVAAKDVRHPDDLERIRLPSQYNTNISAGVVLAVDTILAAAPPPDTHVLVTFLSDGAHNQGPALTDAWLATLRSRLGALAVSVVVVGVGAASDTTLGMKIKTALETVAVPGLSSIYYAPTSSAMSSVLVQLRRGLEEHVCGGGAARVRCHTHTFTETGTHEAAVYVAADGEAVLLLNADGTTSPPPAPVLDLGGDPVRVTVTEMDPAAVAAAVDAQIMRLSQVGVARGTGAIRADVEDVKGLMHACTAALASAASSELPAWSALRPRQRAAALKAFRRSEVSFREQLNRLEELRCGVANDSARQAAFLTGMQLKYGAKAVRRAGVVDASMADVNAQIATTVAEFAAAAGSGSGAGAGAGSGAGAGDTSILSLNTPAEQLAEWAEVDPATIDEPYVALVAYGMCGYPVRMAHTAAVQMDPWQTACLDVEPYLVDTGSLLLANQTGRAIMGPTREAVTDAIVVVHPECEGASRSAVRSVVNKYLCSVTLCRDLYMFQPAMVTAMHAHVFLTAASKFAAAGGSAAYLRLTLQLLYSLRVTQRGGVHGDLLRHWLRDWGTLTTATADDCKHPVQAVAALATATCDGPDGWAAMSSRTTGALPLLTLLCEVVSRRCRGVVRSGVDAAATLGAMYGIRAANSPSATEDPMAPEPEQTAVRRSCPPAHALVPGGFPSRTFNGAASVHAWVRSAIEPYYHAFRLGHVLQRLGVWTPDGDDAAVFARQQDIAAAFAELPSDPLAFMGIDDALAPTVLEAMFAQGMLYNDAGARVGAVPDTEASGAATAVPSAGLGDVRDPSCLHELLVDVHMTHYAASCEDKRKRWAAAIGDVTESAAMAANLDTFVAMVGTHTHGLSKAVFWSMLRVAKRAAGRGDTSKKDAFIGKSNNTVSVCFTEKRAATTPGTV
jgi:2'-5' RNA ligase